MDVPNSYLLLIVSNLSTNLLCLYVQYLKCFSKLKFDDKKFSKSLLKYAELKTEGKASSLSILSLHYIMLGKANKIELLLKENYIKVSICMFYIELV